MPEISFYLLSTTGAEQRHRFACKLIEKAYRNGYFAYVMTDNLPQSQSLDQLLWTFRPTSFVPHEIYHGTLPAFPNTVLIGHLPVPAPWQKLLINLSTVALTDLTHTEKVLEIVDNDNLIKQAGRTRYRAYQKLGITPITHRI